MIRDFVTFARRAFQDLRILGGIFADDKERRLHMMGREEVEQFWS